MGPFHQSSNPQSAIPASCLHRPAIHCVALGVSSAGWLVAGLDRSSRARARARAPLRPPALQYPIRRTRGGTGAVAVGFNFARSEVEACCCVSCPRGYPGRRGAHLDRPPNLSTTYIIHFDAHASTVQTLATHSLNALATERSVRKYAMIWRDVFSRGWPAAAATRERGTWNVDRFLAG